LAKKQMGAKRQRPASSEPLQIWAILAFPLVAVAFMVTVFV
jgi:hypothetical protein